MLGVTAFASAVPTPLYPAYELRFHFTAGVLGLVFAAYTPGVLLTLFFLAPQAERLGRRRLLTVGMLLTIVASALFALAAGVAWLAVARAVAGLAVGSTTSVATASMNDLEPYRDAHHVARVAVAANFGGFALGAVLSGAFVEFGPDPTHLVFAVPVALAAVGLLAVRALPETASAFGGRLRARVQRIAVPASVRRPFWVAAGGIAACYAIYGLFAALVPSYLRTAAGLPGAAVAGAVVAGMFGLAAAVQLATAQIRDRRALLVGFPLLIASLVALVLVLPLRSGWYLVGVAGVLGVAVGLTFMGSTTLVDRVAPPAFRGEMLAGFYCAGYLALAVPTIGIAEASDLIGLTNSGMLFGVVLAAVVAPLYVLTYRTPTPPGGGGRAAEPTTGPA